MANILTIPESGIFFDGNTAGVAVPPVLTGDASGVAIQYDGYAGVEINSSATGANYLDRFSVEGANGRLFGVTDEVTGTVFSVNDAAGLPIIEVESTSSHDKITIGEYGTDALVISGSSVQITGSTAATQAYVDAQVATSDTLQEVTANGATTTNSISIHNSLTSVNPRLSVGRDGGQSIQLHVSDITNTIQANQDSDSNGDHIFALNRVFGGTGKNDFQVQKGGSAQLTIDSTGNVGIGITNPSRTLHIVDSAGPTIKFQRSNSADLEFTFGSANASIASAGEIQFRANGGTTNKFIINNSQIQSNAKFLVNTNSGIDVHTSDSGNILLSGNSSATGTPDQFFLKHNSGNVELGNSRGNINITSGNVGIGTTNATAKLYIEHQGVSWNATTQGPSLGTIHLDPVGNGAEDTGNAITFGASDTGNGTTAQAGIYIRSDGSYGTKMYLSTTDSYASGSKTRLMINHNGNVGIGTTSPAAKLQVYSTATRDIFISGHGTQAQNDWTGEHAFFISAGQGVIIGKANANNNTNRLHILYNDSSGNANYLAYNTSNTAKIHLNTNGDSYLNGGDVGIGTTSPVGKLNINTGLTGISYDMVNQANGSISFSNNSGGTAAPTITGKSNNNLGLMFVSGTNNTGPVADMYFDVRENDNTDYATLTSTAYRFNRAGNALMTILRSGKVGIGTTTSLNGLLNVGSPSATNVKVSRIAGDTTTVYHYGSSEDATLEWTCGSYFNSEVVITASQTNGGTYNNLYIRGIWSNNHTSHHWDELEHVGSLTGTTFTITNGQNGSTTNSGRLTLDVDYVNGSFATLNIRITDFYATHSYTIT